MVTALEREAATHLPPYLKGLNGKQQEAVEATEGPLLVLAGAGTGKTRVLTTRIAHILLQGKAFPSQILAVTFTNKAAREMKERIERQVENMADGLWIGTFHSIAAKILRRHAELIGLKPNFTIIDTDDQLRLIKQIMASHHIDDKKLPPKNVLGIIQRFKDRALLPHQVSASEIPDYAHGKIIPLYSDYQNRLQQLGACDFGDLLLHNITLFTAHTDILAEYHNRFRYMLVDEYQDTNVSQYLWLRLLAQARKNICCVGDDDQSIYGWRGAEVGNILKFEHDFPNAQTIRLEQNYRSTTPILGAASSLIAYNKGRLGKTLWTDQQGGTKIKVTGYFNNFEESARIADEVSSLQQFKHIQPKNMAVLVRASYQTRSFEEAFINQGIPYRVIGGLRFYERKEIRDMIAYIRLMVEQNDDLAFERIVNVPKRGIGPSTLQQLYQTASERSISLSRASRELLLENALKPKIAKELEKMLESVTRWSKMRETHHHAEIVDAILKESGYLAMLQEEQSIEADGRIDNIKELIRALADFESITTFLEHVSLVSDADDADDSNMVSIMTLHAAKGLEFNTVFLPGWEEGLFPNQRSLDETGNKGLEEERRLAYVGITRARERLYISFAASRKTFGQTQYSLPSRFLDELPEEHIERVNAQNSYNFSAKDTYAGDEEGFPQSISYRKNTSTLAASTSNSGFTLGEKVSHSKFGIGKIVGIQGEHLQILFDKEGLKKVIDQFVKKA